MVAIVRGEIPADEFALHHTLQTLPSFSLEVERFVSTGDQRVMPIVWLRGPDDEGLVGVLESDPTVNNEEMLAEFDEEWLYKMEWTDHVKLMLDLLTNSQSTILDAYGTGRNWEFRMMYPDREALSHTCEFCNEHGLSFDVQSVRDLEGKPAGRHGLTTDQYEALTAAMERGMFEVPRQTTLKEIAEEFDVSHQALSERIRRATGALVEDTLLLGYEKERF